LSLTQSIFVALVRICDVIKIQDYRPTLDRVSLHAKTTDTEEEEEEEAE